MNFFYRHRVVLGLVAIALAVGMTIAVCFYALSYTAQASVRFTVVLDAGHGGIDAGVRGRQTGVKESDLNLEIARELQTVFEEAGFQVVQTRETEAGLYGTTAPGFKRRDMKKRAEIIHENAPALLISVHQNFYPLSSRRGAQVFFRSEKDASYTFACAVQTALNGMEECVKKAEALRGDYYILNCNEYPAIIVECGFLSNAEDEALLTSARYRRTLAQTIVSGALSYLTSASSSNG